MNAFGPHNRCAHLFTCVGIVIGGIAGVLFLLALFSALTAALVKLIRAGKCTEETQQCHPELVAPVCIPR